MPEYGKQTFDPIRFDGAAPPAPDVTDGAYRIKCTAVEVQATKPKLNDPASYPMLAVTWEVTDSKEPKDSPRYKAALGSIGGETLDRIMFTPEEKRGKGRMGKMRYQELCNLLNLDFRIVPLEINDESAFDPFIQALLGQEIDGWVKNEADRNDPDRTWPRLYLTEPRNWGDNEEPAPSDDEPTGDDLEPNDLEPSDEGAAAADGGDVEPSEEPEPDPEPEPPPPAAKRTATKTAAPAAARAATNGAAAKPATAPARAVTAPAKPPARPAARR